MSMTLEKAIQRARKLLAMAENTSNEHEAAQAAERAMKIMREYQLSEAAVRLVDSTHKPEKIVDGFKLEGYDSKKRVAWKGSIAWAVANSLGAVQWWGWDKERGGYDIRCFGRESAVQTWNYTCQYLFREIETLCEARWNGEEGEAAREAGHTAKAWKNAFRLGASHRICTRLRELQSAQKRERQSAKAHVAISNAKLTDINGVVQPHNVSVETQALALIEKDDEEVKSEYAAKEKREGFVKMRSVGRTVSSRTGYDAGKEAGDGIALNAKRAGLPRGQGRIGKEE